MKMLQFKFQPQEIKIGADEILADLNYPVGAEGRPTEPKHPRRRSRVRP